MRLPTLILSLAAGALATKPLATAAPGVFILPNDAVVESDWENDHCTTIIAGKAATVEGATITTHTADCKDCDFRLARVPGGVYPEGAMRDVIVDVLQYPRIVAHDRGDVYKPLPGQNLTAIRGQIPQVGRTYSYYDGTYGIMNEVGLGIGEGTCMSKIKVFANASALFGIGELSHVALERCATARCAVDLMGSLGEEYGFYEPTGEGGEVLTIIDPEEAWVFAISGNADGRGAIWAAQRVPDDHVCAVANWFTIGELDLDDSDNYRASKDIMQVAKDLGFWNPREGPFHFAKAFSPVHEAKSVHYTARRVWRVFDVLDPEAGYNAHLSNDFQLPFSVKPARKVSVSDIMQLNRDHYEGSEFDMTQGLASGPFGTPTRQEFKIPPKYQSFQRAISIHRTSYSTVIQSRANMPEEVTGLLYFAPDAPHSSCYVPFYSGGDSVPQSYSIGSLWEWALDSSVAWWVFDFVSNYMNIKYSLMLPLVKEKQHTLESNYIAKDAEIVAKARELVGNTNGKHQEAGDDDDSEEARADLRKYLSHYTNQVASEAVSTWWELLKTLIVRFNDGYDNSVKLGTPIPYPDWYMDLVALPGNEAGNATFTGSDLVMRWAPTLLAFVVGVVGTVAFFRLRERKQHMGYEPL